MWRTAPAQPAGSEGSAGPSSLSLDLDLLLADPVQAQEAYRRLEERRSWLAGRGGKAEEFEQVAGELAGMGFYTSAIELLWFAQKMAPQLPSAARYAEQMKQWSASAAVADRMIEEGSQLYQAGRPKESLEALLRAAQEHPNSERTNFALAETWRRIYREQYENQATAAPLEIRVKVFQDAYQRYRLALAIDPLFYDAYYGISELRGIFPEDREFLLRTQPDTQRALDFRAELVPVLTSVETGAEDPALMMRLGEAFEKLGIRDYAVYSYQTARALGGQDPKIAERLEALQAGYNAGGAPAGR